MQELLNKILAGTADFNIGMREKLYLKRWFARNESVEGNLYIHHILNDDDDRALHDHPWDFISILIGGGYREHTKDEIIERRVAKFAAPMPDIVFRKAEHAHRLELFKNIDGNPMPAWTIVITGPRRREWGFHCPQGWVHWKDFVAEDDHGNIGKGCG